ncbi:hypothetical protein Ciccas_013976 [Cichlidogyrus casuarinus]|uniref:Uncharacterized protein n=1 Tax=Cichlidogyrus casuarinus TaxID=1844966 RepID=A0ABD2PKY3_9PLAT
MNSYSEGEEFINRSQLNTNEDSLGSLTRPITGERESAFAHHYSAMLAFGDPNGLINPASSERNSFELSTKCHSQPKSTGTPANDCLLSYQTHPPDAANKSLICTLEKISSSAYTTPPQFPHYWINAQPAADSYLPPQSSLYPEYHDSHYLAQQDPAWNLHSQSKPVYSHDSFPDPHSFVTQKLSSPLKRTSGSYTSDESNRDSESECFAQRNRKQRRDNETR